jgi:MFS family permease
VGVAMLVVMFAGLAMGAEGDMLPYFVGRYFGRANFAPIYAVNFGLFAVGYGFLPVLAGYIYDLVGSYGATFLAFGVLMLAVTAAMLLLGAYPQEEGGTGA